MRPGDGDVQRGDRRGGRGRADLRRAEASLLASPSRCHSASGPIQTAESDRRTTARGGGRDPGLQVRRAVPALEGDLREAAAEVVRTLAGSACGLLGDRTRRLARVTGTEVADSAAPTDAPPVLVSLRDVTVRYDARRRLFGRSGEPIV